MGDIIEQVYLAVVGMVSLGVFGGLAFYIMHASHSRWREFEPFYAAIEPREPMAKKLAGMLRVGPPGFRWGHLSGERKSERYPPVVLGVHPDGLSLTIVPPFRHGCRDLFLPFERMTVEPAAWDLSSSEYGIQMEGVNGLEIVMFSNVMQWAAEKSEVLDLMLQRAELVRGLQRA